MSSKHRMGMMLTLAALVAGTIALQPTPALAYVGPGAGLSLLGSVIGLLAAIFTAIGIVLSWPIRLVVRRIRNARAAKVESGSAGEASGA
jgi:nicotinamide riboside transporter PnuC